MRIAVFSAKEHDREALARLCPARHAVAFLDARLEARTAELARGFEGVCAFVNDDLSAPVLAALRAQGTTAVLMRCAGTNNVDAAQADALGIRVANVPDYSPNAVSEHALALVLSLNRHIHRAYARAREGNFSLRGLMGFDMAGTTVGVVGTGRIGSCLVRALLGMGCRVLMHDTRPSADLGCERSRYVELDELLRSSRIVSLHCPLLPETHHMIDGPALAAMPRGAMLINTSRGGLIDTRAVIAALKSGHLGALGIDVYEEEAGLFFQDGSEEAIQDDVFARLLTFPNVLITGHQGFFTREAVDAIAATTFANADALEGRDTDRSRDPG